MQCSFQKELWTFLSNELNWKNTTILTNDHYKNWNKIFHVLVKYEILFSQKKWEPTLLKLKHKLLCW